MSRENGDTSNVSSIQLCLLGLAKLIVFSHNWGSLNKVFFFLDLVTILVLFGMTQGKMLYKKIPPLLRVVFSPFST